MDGARLAQCAPCSRRGAGAEQKEETGGFGLFNVNQRIQLNYGREYGLKIQSTYGQGTEIWVGFRARQKIKENATFPKNYTF